MKYPLHHIGIVQGFKNTGLSKHYGIDFGWSSKDGGKNPPVYSISDGEVIYYRKQTLGGYTLRIKHFKNKDGKFIYSEYGHLQKGSIKVKVGDKVKKYQHIANMGGSGVVTGNHLHLAIYVGSYAKANMVDPTKYLCLYDDQNITDKSKKNYKIYHTKKVVNCTTLNIRSKPNTTGKVVGTAKKGTEVESFGTSNGWNIVDNIRGYYCSNKYVK